MNVYTKLGPLSLCERRNMGGGGGGGGEKEKTTM